MNKRIKELIQEATKVYEPDWNGAEGFEDFDKEKFAELIIRECVEICDNTTGTSYLNGWYAGKQIRKHFGVEL